MRLETHAAVLLVLIDFGIIDSICANMPSTSNEHKSMNIAIKWINYAERATGAAHQRDIVSFFVASRPTTAKCWK